MITKAARRIKSKTISETRINRSATKRSCVASDCMGDCRMVDPDYNRARRDRYDFGAERIGVFANSDN